MLQHSGMISVGELNSRERELRGRELENQREQHTNDDTGSCQSHPETASAQKLSGLIQIVENPTRDQDTNDGGYDLVGSQTNTGNNQKSQENGSVQAQCNGNQQFHLLIASLLILHSKASN